MGDRVEEQVSGLSIEQSDKDLIAACLDGDETAWEILIVRYQRLVYSIPIKAQLSSEDADDVFQSVWLKLWESLSTLRDCDNIMSWMIATTTNECRRLQTRRSRQNTDSEDLGVLTELATISDEELTAIKQQYLVREATASLTEQCQKLVELLFYERDKLSSENLALRMNMPISSLAPLKTHCLENLMRLLKGRI